MKIELKFQLNALTILLGINLIIFILGVIAQATIGFDNNLFALFGGLDATKVYSGELWLLITSAFFHLDILHFLFNIYALYKIGQSVLNFYDDKTLIITYILGALGGSLLSYFSSYFFGQNILSLGASGAIFALIGLLLGGSLKKYRYGFALPFSIWDVLPVVVFSLWIGFIPGSQINNFAHVGGLFTGVVLGLILKHSLGGYRSKFDELLKKALYIISMLIFIGSFVALIYNAINLIFLN